MNKKIVSILSLLLITNLVLALETNTSSYWDEIERKAQQKMLNSSEKAYQYKNILMNTHDGAVHNAHHRIFFVCEDIQLDKIASMQKICQHNNSELIKALKNIKKHQAIKYERYKQSLKEYAYDITKSIALDDINEKGTAYRGQWNKERAIQHVNDNKSKIYESIKHPSALFLEDPNWNPEYAREDIERAISDVLNLIEEYDKIYHSNNEAQQI